MGPTGGMLLSLRQPCLTLQVYLWTCGIRLCHMILVVCDQLILFICLSVTLELSFRNRHPSMLLRSFHFPQFRWGRMWSFEYERTRCYTGQVGPGGQKLELSRLLFLGTFHKRLTRCCTCAKLFLSRTERVLSSHSPSRRTHHHRYPNST